MSKRNVTLAAFLAPPAVIAATLVFTAESTAGGYNWKLGPLQLSYSDLPSLS